ncbi:MAG: AraC family transcriptional regulator [Ruminococcaceae bacterium]|nr:AraC family transcriptional regulator [Oscillospiraceae bacterium]
MENNNISFILNNHFTIRHCTARDGNDTPSAFYCNKGLRRWSRFFYLVQGTIDFTSHTGKSFSMSSGDIMYLPYDIEYSSAWTDKRDGYYYSVEFILEYPDGENLNLFDDITLLFRDNGGYKNLFADMVTTVTESAVGSHLKCLEQLMHLLYLISMRMKDSTPEAADIRSAIDIIETGFASDTDVNELASICHMSPATFRRKFRKYTSMSPIEYRNTVRLNKARELLLTGYNVGEVSDIVGIGDISYFSKLYKNHFGVSPINTLTTEFK